ncbi:MAG: T9SS type A sorting domain-containing protein [Bacteroidia bacterium]|jgi:hypothetical protein|nr:T9SS type A sorting domain-containing protein [Bacteroidia bacterium]
MNTNLQHKLKKYSAAVGGMTLASGAGAQIVYTDINPDTLIIGGTYSINMDNAGNPEMIVNCYSSSTNGNGYSSLSIQPPGANAVRAFQVYAYATPEIIALNAGDTIGAQNTDWIQQSAQNGNLYLGYVNVSGNYTIGQWPGLSDKFMGVRFTVNNQPHYGWVRLSLSIGSDSLLIKDYAYNSQPNQYIIAGQTVITSETETEVQQPYMHVYDRALFVNLPEVTSGASIHVYNTMGQTVLTYPVTERVERIELGELPAGVYLVQLTEADGTVTSRKIYL